MTPANPMTTMADDDGPDRPLVITDAPELLDDLLRLAAAAGASVTVAADPRAALRRWRRARTVVVGRDRAADCIAADLPPRRDVVLVSSDAEDSRIWSLAARLRAEHVVFLPAAEAWLVDLLGERRRTTAVGVVGGSGGVGATSLAVTITRAGLRRGIRSVLVEIDPLGGLGLLPDPVERTAGGSLPGPDGRGIRNAERAERYDRWEPGPVVGSAPGVAGPGADPRRDDLPDPMWTGNDEIIGRLLSGSATARSELPVLSWDREAMPVLPPPAVAAMFSTARGAADLVIADLPRSTDPACEVGLLLCETVLLVAYAEPVATAAAARVCALTSEVCRDVRVVVRMPRAGRRKTASAAAAVADVLGVPLAGVIHDEPGVRPETMAAFPPRSVDSRPTIRRRTAGGKAGGKADGRLAADPPAEGDPVDDAVASQSAGSGPVNRADAGTTVKTTGTTRVGGSLIQFADAFLTELGSSLADGMGGGTGTGFGTDPGLGTGTGGHR